MRVELREDGLRRGRGFGRRACLLSLSMVAALLSLGHGFGGSPAVAAEPPSALWGDPGHPVCPIGSGSGQCNLPRGVAADPNNGHIFLSDQNNHRIDEFNALGQFIKAWGWGVDTGAAELQICTETSTCQEGSEGSGTGQLSAIASGVSLDSAGNVYITDRGFLGDPSVRVQKFSPTGEFLSMFGGGVNKTKVEAGGSSEEEENLCPFDPGDECQKGTIGTGQGQFGEWAIGDFIAIDDKGTDTEADDKVYVGDTGRIQVFDTEGHYQSEIAVVGVVLGLDVDDAGNLYVVFNGQAGVHKLSPIGKPLAPEIFELPQLGGSPPIPTAVAVDPEGSVFAFGPTNPGSPTDPIFEFDATGTVVAQFGKGEFSASTGLATNLCPGSQSPGNLYATNASSTEAFLRAYGTEPIGCFKARTQPATNIEETTATLDGIVNPSGLEVTECFFEYGTTTAYGQTTNCVPKANELGTGSEPVLVHANIGSLEKGTAYHFRLIAAVGGETETGADEEFKTKGPPVISEDHTVSASDTEATLKALVSPEGFPTSCHFDYTSQVNFKVSGFIGAQSTEASSIGTDSSEHPILASIENLFSGTTYRWRIICSNSSGESESAEPRTLRTYLRFLANPHCSNQAFRAMESASLPDCRAYEMVSPIDKNGGDIVKGLSGAGDPGGYVQASPDGTRITYTALAAFAAPPSAVNFNQYLGIRRERGEHEEGWASEGIHQAVAGQRVDDSEFGIFREFMAFSPDLCSAWLVDYQKPAPTADGQEDYRNLYRRDNCGADVGGLEALIPSPSYELPPGTTENYVGPDSVQAYSADSRHAIFTAKAKLSEEAAAGSNAQLYDRFCPAATSKVCNGSEGALSLISILPNGSLGDPAPGDGKGFAAPGASEVGSGVVRNRDNAVSNDGTRVYWTSGKIYLRLRPEQGIVPGEFIDGECSEPATVACTLTVSTTGDAFFWTAAADGSKALYTEGEDLYLFDLKAAEEKEPNALPLAHHVKGVAGASEDLSRIYFVSTDVLPGAGANSEGEEAVAGQPNLYLGEEGAMSFIGTLVAGDVGAKEPGTTVLAYNIISPSPYERATRVTSDGTQIAFESRAPLTGYDNASADGKASVEVFIYEAGGELTCVSCNPSGARPSVQELRVSYTSPWSPGNPTKVPAAAWIPTWEQKLHASNVFAENGNRLFFNSLDALLPADANSAQDVYEWEALGTGGCNAQDTNYFPQNDGCLYLISTGESPYEAEFWEASPDGDDIFFTTEASLVSTDPGSVDLYDARVEGGFPVPIAKAPCEGEACQIPPPPPQFQTPSSSTYSGPDNLTPQKKCPKGKRKVRKGGKVRCVKKHKAKKQKAGKRKANSRGAGR